MPHANKDSDIGARPVNLHAYGTELGNRQIEINPALLRSASIQLFGDFHNSSGIGMLRGRGALIYNDGILGIGTISHVVNSIEVRDFQIARSDSMPAIKIEPDKFIDKSLSGDKREGIAFYPLSSQQRDLFNRRIVEGIMEPLEVSLRFPRMGEVVAIANRDGTQVDLNVVSRRDPYYPSSNVFLVSPPRSSALLCSRDSGSPVLSTVLSSNGTYIATDEVLGFVMGVHPDTVISGERICGPEIFVKSVIDLQN